MKCKFILAALLLAGGVQSAWAQKMILKMAGQEPVIYKVSQMEYIMFEEANPDDHEWVDLGLPSGTLWATCNIGADKPEDYGGYFAWGETATKEGYSWGNYAWMTEGKDDWLYINKYTFADGQADGCWYSGSTFIGDNKTELELADDAAFALWGSKWQMPSKEQFDELINNAYTTSEWTAQNGVTGCKITSRSNGNTLFLPASGYFGSSSIGSTGTTGNYWTRSLSTGSCGNATNLYLRQNQIYCTAESRKYGQSIRPVRKDHDYVDLGLPSGTLWATCNVGAESPEEYGDYFAWGETEPKECYTWENYKWCMGTRSTITKYSFFENDEWTYNGFYDGLTDLLPEDDAATANWGGSWQMPSNDQWYELINETNTTFEWTTQNGVNGVTFTSRSNGKSLFLPAAGFKKETVTNEGERIYYWSRTHMTWAYANEIIEYYNNKLHRNEENRCLGSSVRPVRKK